jgi:hypothetical protein
MANNLSVDDLRQLAQALNNLTGVAGDLSRRLDSSGNDVENFKKSIRDASNEIGAGFASMAKTLGTGNGNLAAYNSSITTITSNIAKVASNFGMLGAGIGAVVKLFGTVVSTVNEFNANVIAGYDAIAKFGVAGRMSTEDLRKMGLSAGFANDRLDEYSGLIRTSGEDILTLGKSATDGYKALGQITEYSGEYLNQMSRLGLKQEDLVRNTVDYIKLQAISGISMRSTSMSVDELKIKTKEYNRSLIELSDFTGLEVEEVKRRQQIARASIDVQTKNMMMQDEEARLRAAGNVVAADNIKKEREKTNDLLGVMGTLFTGEKMAAVQSMVVTKSFNELSSSFAAGMPKIIDHFNAVIKGDMAIEEVVAYIVESNAKNRQQFGQSITLDKQLGEQVAYNTETIAIETRYRNMSSEDIKKNIELMKKQREDALKANDDERLRQRGNLVETEMGYKRLRDGLISSADKFFGLTKILNFFGDILKNLINWVGKILSKAGMLDKSLEPYFMSQDEIVGELKSIETNIQAKLDDTEPTKLDPNRNKFNYSEEEARAWKESLEKARKDLLNDTKFKELQERRNRLQSAYQYQSGNKMSYGNTSDISYMQKLAQIESSGDPNKKAQTTSAGGLFQFTEQTFSDVSKKYNLGFVGQDRFDPLKAERAAELLRKEHIEALKQKGIADVGDTEEYLLWFLGQGNGIKFIEELRNNPGQLGASLFKSAAESNPSIFYDNPEKKSGPKSLHDIYRLFEKKLEQAGVNIRQGKTTDAVKNIKAQFGGIFSGPLSGYDAPHRADMQMHQTELIQPLSKDSVLQQLATKSITEIVNTNNVNNNNSDLIPILISKVDDMISLLRNSNDIQNDILSYGMN